MNIRYSAVMTLVKSTKGKVSQTVSRQGAGYARICGVIRGRSRVSCLPCSIRPSSGAHPTSYL